MRQESRIQRDSFHFITRRYIAKRYSGGVLSVRVRINANTVKP